MIKTFIGFDRIWDEDPKMNISPSWSPDRREIVFANDSVGGRIGNFEIFKFTLGDHDSLRQLTFRDRANSQPAFSPDGSRILFVSDLDGNAEIYLMNSDGTGLLRLTRNPAEDKSPHWTIDGRNVVFSSTRGGKSAIYEIGLQGMNP
jgi:Tol biopolymer transport system component